MKYAQSQGAEFAHDSFAPVFSADMGDLGRIVKKLAGGWLKCKSLVVPLAFLGERRFTSDTAAEANRIMEGEIRKLDISQLKDYQQKYAATALDESLWYGKKCSEGKLPHDGFPPEKMFVLSEEELRPLTFAQFYFEGLKFVEDFEAGKDVRNLWYICHHPNDFNHMAGCGEVRVVTETFHMPGDLAREAKEVSQNVPLYADGSNNVNPQYVDYIRKRIAIEKKAADEILRQTILRRLA